MIDCYQMVEIPTRSLLDEILAQLTGNEEPNCAADGRRLGYACKGSGSSTLTHQLQALKQAACYDLFAEPDGDLSRPALGQVLRAVRPADTLIVPEFAVFGSIKLFGAVLLRLGQRCIHFESIKDHAYPLTSGDHHLI